MARSRREPEEPDDDEDDEEEDEDEVDEALVNRDFIMARALGAISSLDAAKAALIELGGLFVNPDDDQSGKKRREAIEEATEAASCALRGLEEMSAIAKDKKIEIAWAAPEPFDEEED